MTCTPIKNDLSAYLDGDLSGARRELVSAHLESCRECAAVLEGLVQVSDVLGSLPRLAPPEPLGPRVLDRLEVESRGPGLALLFRPAWAARPLIFPSMLPAALVLVCTLSTVLTLGARDMRSWAMSRPQPRSAAQAVSPFLTAEDAPRTAADIFMEEQLSRMTPSGGDIFIETSVSPDGRVSGAWVVEGKAAAAAAILKELRQQRGAPGRDSSGRPVPMPAFWLISAVEVRAPLT